MSDSASLACDLTALDESARAEQEQVSESVLGSVTEIHAVPALGAKRGPEVMLLAARVLSGVATERPPNSFSPS